MATWARMEVFLFIVVSLLYLLFVKQKKRTKKFIYFAMPIIFVMILVVLYIYITGNSTIKAHLRFNELVDRLVFFYVQYKQLRDTLKTEAFLHRQQMLGFFISAARTNAWLVAIGTLLNRFLETLLYLFAFVYALGFTGLWHHIKHNIQVRYFVVLSLCSILLLYIQTLSTWWIEYRHMYILIIPSFINYWIWNRIYTPLFNQEV